MKPSSIPVSSPKGKSSRAYLSTLNPSLAREWHPVKNGSLTPAHVKLGSNKRIWWVCARGHEWQQDVFKRNAGSGCPVCANRKVLAGFNDLATTHPELLTEWDYAKNTLDPTAITAGISQKAFWRCAKCKFSWEAVIGSRKNGHGCPSCAGRAVVVGKNDLKTHSRPTIKFWDFSKNGDLKPTDFAGRSRKVVWWRDKRCGHTWQRSIAGQAASGLCPVCLAQSKVSFPEKAIAFYLRQALLEQGSVAQENYIFCSKPKRELDIYIPGLRVGSDVLS
ncbi:zinc-ribbon domain-containing protein, partial [Candidatus Saccharibacteria bacterium]|nr:zinc-ribbon domain-containing protein [Candidatus Saccharibacteria bacterium]